MEQPQAEIPVASTHPSDSSHKKNESVATTEDLLLLKAELRESMATKVEMSTMNGDLREEIKRSNVGHWVFWGTTLIVANRYIFPRISEWLNGL